MHRIRGDVGGEYNKKQPGCFFWGAILPDAFFYYMAPLFSHSSHFKKISLAFHLKNGTQNIERAKSFFSSIAWESHLWHVKLAFAAGIITHVVSDRIIHNVIDHYVNHWNHAGPLAMATHREFETWMDMVLLSQSLKSPTDLQLEKQINMPRFVKECLLSFYLDHVSPDGRPVPPCLLTALRRANRQQIFLLKLFRTNQLFPVVALLNKMVGGRFGAWSSLFYPRSVTPDTFSILNHLDADTLTDGRSFKGSLSDLAKKAITSAQNHILEGFGALKAQENGKSFTLP